MSSCTAGVGADSDVDGFGDRSRRGGPPRGVSKLSDFDVKTGSSNCFRKRDSRDVLLATLPELSLPALDDEARVNWSSFTGGNLTELVKLAVLQLALDALGISW